MIVSDEYMHADKLVKTEQQLGLARAASRDGEWCPHLLLPHCTPPLSSQLTLAGGGAHCLLNCLDVMHGFFMLFLAGFLLA